VAEQAGVTPQGAGRLRLGSHVAALVLGGLVLVLAVAAVPLARLAHMSLNAATASVPVWVTAPGAVGASWWPGASRVIRSAGSSWP